MMRRWQDWSLFKMKSTLRPKPAELIEIWHIIDAEGQILGRLAGKIVRILIGKHHPNFDPAVLNNEKVIVINAAKIKFTGNKLQQKLYRHHSGYPGGLKTTTLEKLIVKDPNQVLEHAVSGMLPKNKLRPLRLKNLRIYQDANHPHQAQNPIKLEM